MKNHHVKHLDITFSVPADLNEPFEDYDKSEDFEISKISEHFYKVKVPNSEIVIRYSLLKSLPKGDDVKLVVCQCHIPYMFLEEDQNSINALYAIYIYVDTTIGEKQLKDGLGIPLKDLVVQHPNVREFIERKLNIMGSSGPCMRRKAFPLNEEDPQNAFFEEFYWNGFYYMPMVTTYGHFFYYRREFERNDWYNHAFNNKDQFYAGSFESKMEYDTGLRILICRDVKVIQIVVELDRFSDGGLVGKPVFPLNKF